MKAFVIKSILFFGFLLISFSSFSQCDILNRLFPDGSMLYYMEPVVFYWTSAKELKGDIYTDKENYFIGLQPIPFPAKSLGNKLKEDLILKLANDKVYKLSYYDTQYLKDDSIMQLLYLIDKKDIQDLLNNEATEVKIDMKGEEGMRTYVFKLHKTALQEQLACFIKKDDDGGKDK